MKQQFEIARLADLPQVAHVLISLFSEEQIFVFDGEMGAGKTTLIGEICKLLSITDFSSPTYSIVNTYDSPAYGEIYHFDFYRLADEQEAVNSGLDEMLYSGNVCFLEWASKISKLLPPTYVRVGIHVEGDARKIMIEHIGKQPNLTN